jgi:cytidylate kinase
LAVYQNQKLKTGKPLERVISLINQYKGEKVRIVAIDGHSAAGKSTLAQKLTASLFNVAII